MRRLCNIERNQDHLCQLGFLSPSGSLTGFGSSYTASLKQGVATANDVGSSNPPVLLEHEPVGRAVDRRSGRGRGRTSMRVWHAGCSAGNHQGSRHRPSIIDDPGSTNVTANANVAIGGRVAGSRRGHGRGVHGGATRSPSKPAALQVQQDWTMCSINEIDENFQFVSQNYVIDHLLSDHCKSCAQNIQSQLSLFHLLISTAFDSIIEFTNESLNEKNLIPLSYGELRCFIGTLLMTSVFNTSVEKSWELMSLCTLNKHVSCERFIQLLTNLRGYDVRRRIINNLNACWIDQHNQLDHLHTLEKKSI